MSEAALDQEEPGFAFTDEDYTRRYSSGRSAHPVAPATAPPGRHQPARLHGGGNSFMRARRRRLAAASEPQ